MVDRKVSRLGYDNLPRDYRDIPRAGSRARDRYDEIFKERVIAREIPGDAAQRIARLEKRAEAARGKPSYGPICVRLQRERFKLRKAAP